VTSDAIVDRVRSLCVGEPFGFTEATAWHTFDLQPTTNIDKCFRILPPNSQSVLGGFDFYEDRVDSMQIWVSRKHGNDWVGVRRALLRDVHSLTSAVMRDGSDSGDYAVLDQGRGHSVLVDKGLEYVSLRLTLPINYEISL